MSDYVWAIAKYNKPRKYRLSEFSYMRKRFARSMGKRLAWATWNIDDLALFKSRQAAMDFLLDRWAKYPFELPNTLKPVLRKWGKL